MRILPFILLVACGRADPPSDALAPPPRVRLADPYALAGVGAMMELRGDPGERLELVAGPPGQSCPAPLNGTCLDIRRPVHLGGTVLDGAGRGFFFVDAPLVAGDSFQVQAVWLRPGAALVSSVRTAVVLPDQGYDVDHDGLLDRDELLNRSSPLEADSDQGGSSDAEELGWGTDPLDPSDDIRQEQLCDDGRDGDLDGRVDCLDPDCTCAEITCDDGIDDDGNGLVDCEDLACLDSPLCVETDCDDGGDGDGDGLVDCEDDDCWSVDCHDNVISWVTGGHFQVANGSYLYRGVTAGRVLVEGPGADAVVCSWSREHDYLDAGPITVDPACRLDDQFMDIRLRHPSPNQPALSTTQGSLRYPVTWSSTVYGTAIASVQPGPADADCADGSPPTQAYLDADSDGYGVATATDLWGGVGGRLYLCGPMPGTTTVPGDCDDGDATWNPVDVALAAGATCRDAAPWDRDADGVPAMLDSDDNDGGVP